MTLILWQADCLCSFPFDLCLPFPPLHRQPGRWKSLWRKYWKERNLRQRKRNYYHVVGDQETLFTNLRSSSNNSTGNKPQKPSFSADPIRPHQPRQSQSQSIEQSKRVTLENPRSLDFSFLFPFSSITPEIVVNQIGFQ